MSPPLSTPQALTRRPSRPPWVWLLVLASSLLLGGCASVIRIDNQVDSHPAWVAQQRPQAGQTFQIQRLPSQQGAPSPVRDVLEEALRQELRGRGLLTVGLGQRPDWTVEVSARSIRYPHAPWDDPWDRGGLFVQYGMVRSAHGLWLQVPVMRVPTPPYYQREVQVLVRAGAGGQTVFESRAQHDGPWADNPPLWQALVKAALDSFPNPPAGPRQVPIEIPR